VHNDRTMTFGLAAGGHGGSDSRIVEGKMEAPPGFEPGMEVLQTSALPLGYGAGTTDGEYLKRGRRRLERETGFEPATSTLARSHSTTELFPLAPTTNP
jgi:hypothetical protein